MQKDKGAVHFVSSISLYENVKIIHNVVQWRYKMCQN